MSDDNPFHIDQDKLIAGVAALGDWLDKHGPAAAFAVSPLGIHPASPKRAVSARVSMFYRRVHKYRKHGERRGVVRRRESLIANVEWGTPEIE